MFLFMLGVVEMFIVSYWTKTVADSRIYLSGFVTVVNVLIWYYVLQTFISDMNNWYLVLSYAVGCAVGTMLCGFMSVQEDKKRSAKKRKQALSKLENTSLVIE